MVTYQIGLQLFGIIYLSKINLFFEIRILQKQISVKQINKHSLQVSTGPILRQQKVKTSDIMMIILAVTKVVTTNKSKKGAHLWDADTEGFYTVGGHICCNKTKGVSDKHTPALVIGNTYVETSTREEQGNFFKALEAVEDDKEFKEEEIIFVPDAEA